MPSSILGQWKWPVALDFDGWKDFSKACEEKVQGLSDRLFHFHIDIAEIQTAEGKLYLYVAIDRTSKFAFVKSYRQILMMARPVRRRRLWAEGQPVWR